MLTRCLLTFALTCPALAGVEYRTLHDEDRGREIPVKLYTPDDADSDPDAARPLVLFSHGLGGSVEGATYLCAALAERGYVVAAVQHPGSDESVWRDAAPSERLDTLKRAASVANALERPRDVSFALDELLADADLRIDAGRIGMMGHSFGANTTMLLAGQNATAGRSLRDDRIRAAVAMSGRPANGRDPYANVEIPILHTTGTNDVSMIERDITPEDRTYAFRHIEGPDGFLIVFDRAGHGVFSGQELRPRDRDEALADHVHAAMVAAVSRFFDAYLAAEPTPLTAEDFRQDVGEQDVVEAK